MIECATLRKLRKYCVKTYMMEPEHGVEEWADALLPGRARLSGSCSTAIWFRAARVARPRDAADETAEVTLAVTERDKVERAAEVAEVAEDPAWEVRAQHCACTPAPLL